jgi:hypothetical protein
MHHPQGSGPQQFTCHLLVSGAISDKHLSYGSHVGPEAAVLPPRRHVAKVRRPFRVASCKARPHRSEPPQATHLVSRPPARESSVARNLHSSSRRASNKHQAIVLPFLPSFECDSFSRRRSAMKCSKGGAMILEPRNCDHIRHERCLRALVTSALVFWCGCTRARPAGPGPWSPVLILIGVVAQPADPTSQSPSLLSRTCSPQPGIIWHCPQLGICHTSGK